MGSGATKCFRAKQQKVSLPPIKPVEPPPGFQIFDLEQVVKTCNESTQSLDLLITGFWINYGMYLDKICSVHEEYHITSVPLLYHFNAFKTAYYYGPMCRIALSLAQIQRIFGIR